jgi:hypothetical protein
MARPKCLLLVDADVERHAVVRGAMRRRADLMLSASSVEEARRCLEQCALPIDWVVIDTGIEGALAFAESLGHEAGAIGVLLSSDAPMDGQYKVLRKPYAARDLWNAMEQGEL